MVFFGWFILKNRCFTKSKHTLCVRLLHDNLFICHPSFVTTIMATNISSPGLEISWLMILNFIFITSPGVLSLYRLYILNIWSVGKTFFML